MSLDHSGQNPDLLACFKERGNQISLHRRSGRNDFDIVLFVSGAPKDTVSVIYNLHESYYDPIREATQIKKEFSEEITSYGDYIVTAKILSMSGLKILKKKLSKALRDFYGPDARPDIRSAIQEIEQH